MSALGCAEFTDQARLVGAVATEAIDEPDAIMRHPEVVDAIAGLAGQHGLNDLFGGNGHDPDAFVAGLADALRPYKAEPLNDAPELVQALNVLAVALRGELDSHHDLLLI
jgi:hypothetical protein